MLDFLGFGRSKHEHPDTIAPTQPQHEVLPTATQREMIRLTMHTLLKRHGIPLTWLGAEVSAPAGTEHLEALAIQLVVLQWHDGLMRYAPALEAELLEGLKRFDSSATASKYAIHWKFAAHCGYPHTTLPDASFWTAVATPPPAAIAPAPMPLAATPAPAATKGPSIRQPQPMPPTFNLPSRHEVDDDDDDDHDNGFAATQLHDIR